MARSPLRRKRPFLNDLPRRAYLTVTEHGWSELLTRFLTAPLRLVGLERRFRDWFRERAETREVRRWYRKGDRRVTIVMPTYGAPDITLEAVAKLRRTVDHERVRIVVVDDASPEEEDRGRLRSLEGVELVLAERNAGYAASVNLGIERAGEKDDIVVLNNDVVAHRGWLEWLQHAAYEDGGPGVVGPKLLYPDGRIQSAGSYRNLGAPEWFDHRYRFKHRRYGPARISGAVLAITGACMYVKRELIDSVGRFDDGYPMGYEDVDFCLRAWEAGVESGYEPHAVLTHAESPTRGMEVGEREQVSQRRFWERWGGWFDERPVHTPDGALRVIYVTEDTGVGGGHRDVFEHLNRLRARGHDVQLWSLDGQPDWFPLEAPVREFGEYEDLAAALQHEDAIKIATWWATARWVWRASVRRGIPVYFVQDIETSYYPNDARARDRVLDTYRPEFRFLTISEWNRERLRELGIDAELVPPGIDLENFRPLDVERRDDVVLALGRANPLKDLRTTVKSWKRMKPRPELWMFGVEPEVAEGTGARYIESPSDAQVNELFNTATVLVQTSVHEGFCLPPLEAMASGTPVVCTDAHGNRDFCRDGENCLMVERDPRAVREALERVLRDPELRERLGREGMRTVEEYRWEARIDQLERVLKRFAEPAPMPATRAAG